jgi:hypothetical protein
MMTDYLIQKKITDHSIQPILKPNEEIDTAWDGKTTIHICNKTKKQLCDFFFPTGTNIMRGMVELYNQNPFADPTKPTVAELDNWAVLLINHLRKLAGITTPFAPRESSFYTAIWSEERKQTNTYDLAYPAGTNPPKYGPCDKLTMDHCGYLFLPNEADQQIDIQNKFPPVKTPDQFEGLCWVNKDIPWLTKFSYMIKYFICDEGWNGDHTIHLWEAQNGGWGWVNDSDMLPGNDLLRLKWNDPVKVCSP